MPKCALCGKESTNLHAAGASPTARVCTNCAKGMRNECGKKVFGNVKCTRPRNHAGKHYATHPAK